MYDLKFVPVCFFSDEIDSMYFSDEINCVHLVLYVCGMWDKQALFSLSVQ